MKGIRFLAGAILLSWAVLGAVQPAAAQEGAEVWLLGGVQVLNDNDSAFPDDFVNVPAVLSITYPLTSSLALEGEATWMIPITQQVNTGNGVEADRKSPDVLLAQASLRAGLPFGGSSWRPYLVGGAGTATFLSNDESDRVPALDETETAFAVNFGTGLLYELSPRWALRADYREIVAFPANDTVGLSVDGEADEIWMGRGTVGFGYKF